jgi:Trk-type K+ transport system membrane component
MSLLTRRNHEGSVFSCERAIRLMKVLFTVDSDSWIVTKLAPRNSRLQETLHFLLDHPRRCFVYLFPSYQTWFLLTVLVFMKYTTFTTVCERVLNWYYSFTDWFCFMVLDIGNPDIDSIPLGTRFVAGLLQAIAVRAAGFGIVPLARIAPAVKSG